LELLVGFVQRCQKDVDIVSAGMHVILELTFAQAATAYFTTHKTDIFKRLEEACTQHPTHTQLQKTLNDFKFRIEPKEEKKVEAQRKRLSMVGTPAPGGVPVNDKVVFISYNWGHQKEVVRLSNDLKAAGYKIWLDVDQMAGSTVEAMADGLDSASVVIVDISPQYKESPNCRLEGMYAMQRRLPLIPIMFAERYSPTGWLGLLLGTSLWYKYTEEKNHTEVFGAIMKELRTKIGPPGATGAPSGGAPAPSPQASAPPPPPTPTKPSLRDLTVKDISEWMAKNGLEMYVPHINEAGIDGAALSWLIRKDETSMDALDLVQKAGIKVPGHAMRFLEMAKTLK